MRTVGMGEKPKNAKNTDEKALKAQVKDLTTENTALKAESEALKAQVKDLTDKLAAAAPAK